MNILVHGFWAISAHIPKAWIPRNGFAESQDIYMWSFIAQWFAGKCLTTGSRVGAHL